MDYCTRAVQRFYHFALASAHSFAKNGRWKFSSRSAVPLGLFSPCEVSQIKKPQEMNLRLFILLPLLFKDAAQLNLYMT